MTTLVTTGFFWHHSHRIGKAKAKDILQEWSEVKLNKTCQPPRNIFFLRSYRAASATFYNILARYAMKWGQHWITFIADPFDAFYYKPPHILGQYIHPKFQWPAPTWFNIMGDSALYHKETIERVMGTPVKYYMLLRHPVSHLRSLIVSNQRFYTKNKDPVPDFLRMVKEVGPEKYKIKGLHIYQNMFTKELGFPADVKHVNDSKFIKHFEEVKKTFKIGLSEHFSDYLLTISEELCLTWADMAHVPLRQSTSKLYRFEGNDKLEKEVCQFSPLDCHIYKELSREYQQNKRIDTDLERKLTTFEKVLVSVGDYCKGVYARLQGINVTYAEIWTQEQLLISSTEWSPAFNVTPESCATMRFQETAFGSYFFLRQNFGRCEYYRAHVNELCPIFDIHTTGMNCSTICRYSSSVSDLARKFAEDYKAYIWE